MALGKEIFNIQKMAHTLRYTEYKDITSAANEIVDNSVEAEATNIQIIVDTDLDGRSGKKEINDIAFLDNGTGMDIEVLHNCLVYGETTREARSSIGRFGVGLAQASLFSAPRVEVYSWQNYGEVNYVYLDTNMMAEGTQTLIMQPIPRKFPDKYKMYITDDFKKSGTLVRWVGVDKSPVKQIQTLFSRIEANLGQTYRYFLNDDLVISLVDNDPGGRTKSVKIIDPMFVMENDSFLANSTNLGVCTPIPKYGEPIFEKFEHPKLNNGIYELDVPYYGKGDLLPRTSKVFLKFTVVKEKFYYKASEFMKKKSPGETPIGKHVKNYEGISVVRANREVDFGKFGFYDSINTPVNRWWSVEISFSPELDEIFKISNNKQHVELKKSSKAEQQDRADEFNLWDKLFEVINELRIAMVSRNFNLYEVHKKQMGLQKQSGSTNTNSNSSSDVGKTSVPDEKEEITPDSENTTGVLLSVPTVTEKEETVKGILDKESNQNSDQRIVFKELENKQLIKYESFNNKGKIILNTKHKSVLSLKERFDEKSDSFSNEFLQAFLSMSNQLFETREGVVMLNKIINLINENFNKRGEKRL
jgi:predicted RNA-binding protein with PUA-like domain